MSEVFGNLGIDYEQSVDNLSFDLSTMRDKKMVMENHRLSYPSNKLTFTIANSIKEKALFKWLNIYINLNDQYDVDVVLEDSKRNFTNSPEKSKK